MSTQFTTSIPFSFSHNLAPIRLLELPPALLELLSASESPPILKIKASSGATSSVHSTDNHAVLCTPTQTYSLRQVYSSNSIILLQPSVPLISPPSDDNEDEDTDPLAFLQPSMGLKAVSTAVSYMELVPTIHDAHELLLKHIPLYHGSFDGAMESPTEKVPKVAILSALPISEGEFETAWKKLNCFCCSAGYAHRPSSSAVLAALGEIFTCAAAESFTLSPKDGFAVEALVSIMDDDEEVAIPQGLVDAAVAGVCEEAVAETGRWKLDKAKCASYVGRALLEDWQSKAKGDMLYVSFISRWKSSVPEECVALCKLDCIKGWYTHPTPSTIRFVSGGTPIPAKSSSPSAAAPAPVVTAKNKWHEKFGKGKRR
ncbi:hypothetical protein Q9L58_001750 [Maublancomyces gigas]|uniref:Sister chromatid cohesion protein Dcc1 n=1 Tax=Discina gigas TaxID=1032678 RepID=A0ABR3GTM7_9PEZI